MKHKIIFFLIFFAAVQYSKAQGFGQSNIQQPTCFGTCNGSVTFTTSGANGPFTAVVTNSSSCPNSTTSTSSSTAITITNVCACSSVYTVSIYTGTIIAGVNYVQFPNYASAPLTVSAYSIMAANCPTCCNGSAYLGWTGGNTTFSNNPPSFTIDGVATSSYAPAPNLCVGSHTVCAKDSSQCVACKVFSVSYNPAAGIKVNTLNSHISLFPNPVSTDLTIETNEGGAIAKAIIIDPTGRIVLYNQFDISPQNKIQINVSSLSEGLYYIEVYGVQGRSVHRTRFVKKDN
ncbi:MAG: C-terminal target protein [Bacteroidetes bacterium]|nr:C-terminal target protein [Bacteroidota bacterium]